MEFEALTSMVSTMWVTVAILAAGYARTRNRSAWTWFLLVLFLGPIGAFLLVVWPPVVKRSVPSPGHTTSEIGMRHPG